MLRKQLDKKYILEQSGPRPDSKKPPRKVNSSKPKPKPKTPY